MKHLTALAVVIVLCLAFTGGAQGDGATVQEILDDVELRLQALEEIADADTTGCVSNAESVVYKSVRLADGTMRRVFVVGKATDKKGDRWFAIVSQDCIPKRLR
jgi:hypothetical protein